MKQNKEREEDIIDLSALGIPLLSPQKKTLSGTIKQLKMFGGLIFGPKSVTIGLVLGIILSGLLAYFAPWIILKIFFLINIPILIWVLFQ